MTSADLFDQSIGREGRILFSQVLGKSFDVPRLPGVYAFIWPDPIRRFSGDSDILYIGRHLVNVHGRIAEYGTAVPRVRDDLWQPPGSPRRIAVLYLKTKPELRVAWQTVVDAEAEEGRLLARYEEEHHELPPLNLSSGTRVITPRATSPLTI